jgi:hypothetical protein
MEPEIGMDADPAELKGKRMGNEKRKDEMEQKDKEATVVEQSAAMPDLKNLMRSVIEEYVTKERQQDEPAYKAELVEERRRREQLETQVNQLVQENSRTKQLAE